MEKAIITRTYINESGSYERLIEVDLDDRLYTDLHDGTEYAFLYIPGLDEVVMIRIAPGSGPGWTFDGNKENPTLSPSLLSSYKYGDPQREIRNHIFIRSGMIEYLQDCTHDLAGKTIELPKLRDWPKHYQYWQTNEPVNEN